MNFLKTSLRKLRQQLQEPTVDRGNVGVPPLEGGWLIPGKLMVGPRPRTAQKVLFAEQGFQSVLTLHSNTEATVAEWVAGLEHRQLPLPDSHVAEVLTVSALAAAVDTLAELLDSAAPVYVHCLAGIERSPLVCLGYLCRYRGLTLTTALNHLQQMHPRTCPTDAQMAVLRQYLSEAAGFA